jgi:hypothetical protein
MAIDIEGEALNLITQTKPKVRGGVNPSIAKRIFNSGLFLKGVTTP